MQTKEELVRKLFLNQCTRKELEELFEILKNDSSETGPEVMLELQQQLKTIPPVKPELSRDIYAKIEKEISSGNTVKPGPAFNMIKGNKRLYLWISSAAAVFLLTIGFWMIFSPAKVQQMNYQTAYGEMQELILPDSSKVILNGNSTLSFANRWEEGETRIVELEGEAFFEVRKKVATKAKFQVVTNDLTIEVLGTHFNVNTRQEETKVFLEEGKIQVRLDHQKDQIVDLAPGEGLRYSTEQGAAPAEKFTLDEAANWRNGFMNFNEKSLQAILENLSMSHKLEFVIADPVLASTVYTLTLPTHNIEEAMDVLAKSTGIMMNKKDGVYEIIAE